MKNVQNEFFFFIDTEKSFSFNKPLLRVHHLFFKNLFTPSRLTHLLFFPSASFMLGPRCFKPKSSPLSYQSLIIKKPLNPHTNTDVFPPSFIG